RCRDDVRWACRKQSKRETGEIPHAGAAVFDHFPTAILTTNLTAFSKMSEFCQPKRGPSAVRKRHAWLRRRTTRALSFLDTWRLSLAPRFIRPYVQHALTIYCK